MRLSIRHRTTYRFERPQARVVQLARLTPPSFAGQQVTAWSIDMDCDARLRAAGDGYGNELTMIYVDGPLDTLSIEVAGDVLTEDRHGVVKGTSEPLPPLAFLRPTALTKPDDAIMALARAAHGAGDGTLARMHALNRAIGATMRFDVDETDVTHTAAEALAGGHGVCQDFTHVFVAAARAIDVPARYVSGHLYRRDGDDHQSAAHAWAEVCVEGLGWVGFDAANGISPDDAYVRVAVGLDYREAAPLAGARVGGGEESLDVSVSVVQTGRQTQG